MFCHTNFRLLTKQLLFLSFIFFSFSTTNAQVHTFIKKYKPLSHKLSVEFQIPESVILGIAIIESGSGKSKNCKLLNNYFGIVGKNNLHKLKGKTYRSRFKQYPDAEASFRDFCHKMSKKKYYEKLMGNSDYHLWIDAMSKSGYSEFHQVWKKIMLNVIKEYNLAAPPNYEDVQLELPFKDSTMDTIP